MTFNTNATVTAETPEIYEGQFGPFTIDQSDRQEVVLYRAGLAISAISFGLAVGCLFFFSGMAAQVATVCYGLLWLGLGLSLFKIHIYVKPLHLALQAFWAIGGVASVIIAFAYSTPLALTAYQQPLTIFGIGFTFAALTGIFFKEAFCFNRLETKFLVFLVPGLLLGHMAGILSSSVESSLLIAWAGLFAVFALRKVIQPIPPDIGDKSVFEYLAKERQTA
ncbi:MAG: hypothetical protein DCF25_06370 [Leptolyngbya foveolarum]|uniref:DUF2301 domain-containing membrane protein n=1 Tax=Leptolyngbya foveolarum TaxID=47253 RepID=A0A2W4UH07_9CYAN|nr:MAG: hypothetical protein DCF25_06370 [Leptolyngbya foveolarum]